MRKALVAHMTRACSLLRIYTEERARAGSKPLYEAIVLSAREAGLSGATVLRGPLGYGRSHRLHNANILVLSGNLPLVIEIIDTEDRLRAFAAGIAAMGDIGLVTLEKVEVLNDPAAITE
jgi:PII-like signaling protein